MISTTTLLLLLPLADAFSLQQPAFSTYKSIVGAHQFGLNRNANSVITRSSSAAAVQSEAYESSNDEEKILGLTEPYQDEIELSAGDDSKIDQQFWKWRNHDIYYEVRTPADNSGSNKPKVILLHGFGASTTYWRETMSKLVDEGFEVHALDLLGQGRSSKPYERSSKPSMVPYTLYPEESQSDAEVDEDVTSMLMGENTDANVYYSINLWAQLVDDYARHNNFDQVLLMGNSLGSLVALSAATGDFIETTNNLDRESMYGYLAGNNVGKGSRVKGVCLFNCAVGLNLKNVLKEPSLSPLQRILFMSIIATMNKLVFGNELLLKFALSNIVTKDLLRDALIGLYSYNPEQVDDELVDSFYYPAKLGGDGAVEAIRQIYTNDPGLTPMELHAKYPEILDKMPLHLIWGDSDLVAPIGGDVGTFYCDRIANNRSGTGKTSIDVVSAGHLLFDDNPVDTHNCLMKWINRKIL